MKPKLIPKKADGAIIAHWVVEYSVDYLRDAPAQKPFRRVQDARAFMATLEGDDK